MNEELKSTEKFLSCLVKLRKQMLRLPGLSDSAYPRRGALGILLKDKSNSLTGCVFAAHGAYGCPPAPTISKANLSKAIVLGYRTGMIPVGVVLLNPDDGEYYEGKARKTYIGGGTVSLSRKYSVNRLTSFLDSFEYPVSVIIVDDENVPMYLEIKASGELESYHRVNPKFKKISSVQKKGKEPLFRSFNTEMSALLSEVLGEEKKEEVSVYEKASV